MTRATTKPSQPLAPTVWIAAASSQIEGPGQPSQRVGAEGSVVTCEFNPDHAAIAARDLARAGLADRVDIRICRALDPASQN